MLYKAKIELPVNIPPLDKNIPLQHFGHYRCLVNSEGTHTLFPSLD